MCPCALVGRAEAARRHEKGTVRLVNKDQGVGEFVHVAPLARED